MNDKPQRADARLHRQRLLEAASAVFSEEGVHVPLERVVARAGVGRATLYRNFPDRDALLVALVSHYLDDIAAWALEFADQDDGLFRVLARMVDALSDTAAIGDYWRAMDPRKPVVLQAQQRLYDIVTPLLQRALATGSCQAELTPQDLGLVIRMIGGTLRGHDLAQRRRQSRRALHLVLVGLQGTGVAND